MLGYSVRGKSSFQQGDILSRIIRTVSLDKSSDEIAAKKPNFSKWVRDQLKLQDVEYQNSHVTLTMFREKGICNPTASPRCNICFPHGRPAREDVREYNMGHISSDELQEITKKKIRFFTSIKNISDFKKNRIWQRRQHKINHSRKKISKKGN